MAKAESRSALTPAQWEIMNLLWEHGELGVAQVWKLLSRRRSIARNTVQTTLTRLTEKGWLRSRPRETPSTSRRPGSANRSSEASWVN